MGKILILANNDIGLYKFRKELIEELLKENEVFISLPNGEFISDLVFMGCKFIETNINRRGINPIQDIFLLCKYYEIVKKIKPDILITYTIKPNIYGGIVSRLNKIEYGSNITGLGTAFQKNGMIKKIVINLYKIALRDSKKVFFENDDNLNYFIENGIVTRKKSCRLNGAGVNLTEYKLTKYPGEEATTIFLFIGRLMIEKGIEEFIDVAKKIKTSKLNAEFHIVGINEEFDLKVLDELQNEGIIKYYGYQKNVKPFIKKSYCVVLPSYHEGMSNTLLESGAMGRPLITTNIFGCKETVNEGQSGFLVRACSKKDLYEKIVKFIELTHEKKIEMGYRSRSHISDVFDRKNVVKITIGELIDE